MRHLVTSVIGVMVCLTGTAWAEIDRYAAVGVQAGAIAALGPEAGAEDPGDLALGIGADVGWRTPYGWLMCGLRVEDQQFGGDLGWQINPLWGVAPVLGLRTGVRRARRGWRLDGRAGDTVRTAVVSGLDVGVRYLDDPGWVVQVLARPSLMLLTNQVTQQDAGVVGDVPGVQAPDPFSFAEFTVAVQVGHSW